MALPDSRHPTPGRQPFLTALRRTWRGESQAYGPTSWLNPFLHTLRGFGDNHGLLLASALSYTTVLSIVPFLAVAFSIAKGLGLYDAPQVHDLLLRLTAGRAEVVEHILGYIQNTNVKTLGSIGTALLLVTAVSLVATIEGALNAIWKSTVRRGLWTRFTTYTALIVLCPVLLFAILGATATLHATAVSRWLLGFSLTRSALTALLALLPLLVVWSIFFLLYKFLPNTKVKSLPALAGALLGGSLWQGLQWAYLKFQFGSASYNAVYGSFAQIPLLLLWLYMSWAVILLGAQVSHTVQQYRHELREAWLARLTQAERHGLGLLLLVILAKAAAARRLPPDCPALANRLHVPVSLVESTLEALAGAGLVAEAAPGAAGRVFVPLARPADVPAAEILRVLDGYGRDYPPESWSARLPVAGELLAAIDHHLPHPTLADLVDRFGARLGGPGNQES
ncbi:MAG: YhjD/YihY/BrkB family envelope integrity protein [Desulfovibrionaceae bacterium]